MAPVVVAVVAAAEAEAALPAAAWASSAVVSALLVAASVSPAATSASWAAWAPMDRLAASWARLPAVPDWSWDRSATPQDRMAMVLVSASALVSDRATGCCRILARVLPAPASLSARWANHLGRRTR